MQFEIDEVGIVDNSPNDEKALPQESQQPRRSSIIRTATEPFPDLVQYSPLSYPDIIMGLINYFVSLSLLEDVFKFLRDYLKS